MAAQEGMTPNTQHTHGEEYTVQRAQCSGETNAEDARLSRDFRHVWRSERSDRYVNWPSDLAPR
jgi:hypothetical protein